MKSSYERLSTALRHQEPDRIPLDLGGTLVTGINIKTLRALREHLGLPEGDEVPDQVTQIALPGPDVRQRLKTDVLSVGPLTEPRVVCVTPVIMAVRLGMQTLAVPKTLVKRMPSAASRSMFGAWTDTPQQPRSGPISSLIIQTIFGRCRDFRL